MACRLVGAKPLSETMQEYWQLDSQETNFTEILIEILTFPFKKMRLRVSSAKWRPFCLGLNVITDSGSPVITTEIFVRKLTILCPKPSMSMVIYNSIFVGHILSWFMKDNIIRKSKDYVYGIRVYKVLGVWKGYYRVKKKIWPRYFRTKAWVSWWITRFCP